MITLAFSAKPLVTQFFSRTDLIHKSMKVFFNKVMTLEQFYPTALGHRNGP